MDGILLAISSVLLLTGGIYIFKKNTHTKTDKWLFVFVTIMSFLLLITYVVISYFTGDGVNEATLYHLTYGLQGAGFAEYFWLILGSLLTLVVGSALIIWLIIRKPTKKEHSRKNVVMAFLFVLSSLIMNPVVANLFEIQEDMTVSSSKWSVGSEFESYYKDPKIFLKNDNQKNIIFIFAEGLERSYFDETLFPRLTKNLSEIESKNITFTNIGQVAGINWTVGGMTASLCGIPLFTPSHGNSMGGMDFFLPSVKCLGDLLKEQNYQLTYMGGADIAFAGKGKLFQSHGFSQVLGREELSPGIDDLRNSSAWGLSDDIILELVYQRFEELSKSSEKFGLFTLTLDTHQPNGLPSKSCEGMVYEDGNNRMLNAVACSDKLIANFINRILQSRFADETVVVLVSDHLAMRNTASNTLQKADRKNLFLIVDPDENEPKQIEIEGSALDIGPTILPIIGFEAQLGLGRGLLGDSKQAKNEREFIRTHLRSWKKSIAQFWGFPRIKKFLKIDTAQWTAHIDERSFGVPILIELDDNLETTLKFQFYKQTGHKSLVEHVKEMKDEKHSCFLMSVGMSEELNLV